MNTEFLPEAEEEFVEAARYYESAAPGVGFRFIAEVHRVGMGDVYEFKT